MSGVERMARRLAADGEALRPLELLRPQAPVLTIYELTMIQYAIAAGRATEDQVRLLQAGAELSADALVGERLARLAG